jgi:hypothetical protein
MGEASMVWGDDFFSTPDYSAAVYDAGAAPSSPGWLDSIGTLLGGVARSTAQGLAAGGLSGASTALKNATTGTVRDAVTPTILLVGAAVVAVLFITLSKH